VKLYTFRTAMGQVIVRQLLLLFSFAAFLACAPSLRAHAVKVSEVPGIANAGGGTVDASTSGVTTRASSLTGELLSLLTAMQIKNYERGTSEEFFTFANVRSGSSESPSARTMIGGNGGGEAVLTARYPVQEPALIGWNLRNYGGGYFLNPRAGTETVPAQMMFGGMSANGHQYVNGNVYSEGKATPTGNAVHNPFVQKNSEVGLSIAGGIETADTDKAGKKVLSLDAKDDVSASAVPEPRLKSLLLLCGIMTAVLIYRRRPRAA